ncbi:SpaA isopeptide-forming pilin-related protein [Allobaculum mucilyticum]|uniref:SpaA isopeptide-forming pilin-related protein n=1 Tax=Allobaculum mucilyticum TaxID=2834459 RepID=UPI001E4D73D4|nr:SpaA isopeptide-forming pilin-related protein [Allobaculum mucilyticum]UNT97273.1 hypothetical protein KWG62_05925 [Allobaculum mucilyticum]
MFGTKQFFKKKHPILLRALTVLTVLATAYALILPATALAKPQMYCGMEEHIHSENCEENCPIPEHTHTRQCESNPEADLEDESVWTADFADILSEASSPAKAAKIAQTQIGKSQSKSNFKVLEDGTEAYYSRYGAWEHNPYQTDIQESFLRFVYSYAGADVSSFYGKSISEWMTPLVEGGLLKQASEASVGDLAFIEDNGALNGVIVTASEESTLEVVEAENRTIVSKSVKHADVYGTIRVLLDSQPEQKTEAEESAQPSSESSSDKVPELAEPAAVNYAPQAANVQPTAGDQTVEQSADCPTAKFPESNPEGNPESGNYKEHPTAAKFFYRYPANSGNTPTEWTEIQPGDNGTIYKMNVEFKMTVNYENLANKTIVDSNHTFYYSIPSFLHSNMAQEGTPLMHTIKNTDGTTKTIELGRLYACPRENHIHIDYSNYQELGGLDIKEGEFEYSLLTNREEIWNNPNQEYKIGDQTYTFKFDTSSSYDDATVHSFKKAKNPEGGNHENYSYDEDGNTIISYQISFVTDDHICPDTIVDDWWGDTYTSWSADFKEGFTPYEDIHFYSVASNGAPTEIPASQYHYVLDQKGSDTPLMLNYTPVTNPNGNATHEVEGSPAPRAGFYLGTLQPNTQYKLTYIAKYKKGSLNTGSQHIRNDSRIHFGTSGDKGYDWEDDTLQSTLTVGKSNLSEETRTDDDGNLYLTYKLSVTAGANNADDWPVGVVTDYMNFQVAGGALQSGYLSYVSMVKCESSSDDQNYTDIPISTIKYEDKENGTKREYQIPAPTTMSRGERYFIKCQIKIDRELMVKMATESKEQLTYINLAYTGTTYSDSGPHSGTVTENIQKSEIVKKAKGEMLTEDTPVDMTGDVYDGAGNLTNVTSFNIPRNSVQYSVKINEDGKANIGSASLTDKLSVSGSISDQFMYTGYAALKVYDGRQEPGKVAIGTIWFKLPEDQPNFNLDLEKYQSSIETIKNNANPKHALSYELVYYVCAKDGADNLLLTNELNSSVGVGIGDGYVPVNQHIQVSHLIVTGEELSAVKRGVSYLSTQKDHEANGTWKAGRQIWLVEVSGSTISKDSTLSDTLTNQTELDGNKYFTHYVPGESVIGLYRGVLNFPFDGTQGMNGDTSQTSINYPAGRLPSYTYQDFLTVLNSQTTRINEDLYSVSYAADNRTVNIQFKENYSLVDENGEKQKLYILLQSTPGENAFTSSGAQPDLIWIRDQANISTGNGFSTIQGNETKKLAEADYGFRSYYTIHKEARSRFAYQNGDFKKLDNSDLNTVLPLFKASLKPTLDEKITSGELSNHEIYDDWTLLVNRQGGDTKSNSPYSGTFKIVDTISENSSFVAAFLAETGDDQPTIDSITIEGQKVTIIVSNVKSNQQFTVHLVSKLNVEWDEAIASDSPIEIVNHVDLYHDQNRIGVDEVTKNTKLPDSMTKGSTTLIDNTTSLSGKSTIEYFIDLNKNRLDLLEIADTIDLKDTYDPNVIQIIPDTIKITADEAPYTDFTVEFRKEEGIVLIRNLPDQKHIHITYSASLQVPPGESEFAITNSCTWLGYDKSAPEYEFTKWATNTIGGTSSSVDIAPNVTLKKVDANNATQGLAGAKFTFTPGTVDNGNFAAKGSGSFTVTTNASGQIILNGSSSNRLDKDTWYKVEETEVPAGYDRSSIEPAQ